MTSKRVLVRGGGDLASGVVACLHRAGWQVLVCELAEPLAVRRKVAFCESVYEGKVVVEDIRARLVEDKLGIEETWDAGEVAVLVDPFLKIIQEMNFLALVDARILKLSMIEDNPSTLDVIGLGPGFEAGVNCLVAIETNRGPDLGKAIWRGKPEADTGRPAMVNGVDYERVCYATCSGYVSHKVQICDTVKKGELIAEVGDQPVLARIDGVLRGLIRENVWVKQGIKIADIDPRGEKELCYKISDKAIIIGYSVSQVLETIYTNCLE